MDARVPLRALNRRLGADLARVLLGVDDDRIFYSAPEIDARPIAEVAVHAYNALLGCTSVVAGVGWPSDPQPPASAAELLATLDAMRARVDYLIAGLPDGPGGVLETEVTLPWGQQVGALDAIADGLAHGFGHVGSLGGIRAIGGFPTPPEIY